MRESVIYQEILQEGTEEGRQSELRLVMRQLTRRIGAINLQLQTQIENLSLTQLEDLGEALLDFATQEDLANWLNSLA